MSDDLDTILDTIHDDLADDGLAIDPSLAGEISPDQLATITSQLADARTPTYVVLYPLDSGDAFSGSAQDLLVRLNAAHPELGTYYALTNVRSYSDNNSFEGRAFDVPGPGSRVSDDVVSTLNYEEPTSLAATTERLAELTTLAPDELAAAEDDARDEWCERNPESCGTGPSSSSGDTDGADGAGGGTTGIVIALAVAVVVVVIAALVVQAARQTRALGPARRQREFRLPPSAMERIREAHDRRLERRARDEMLALGELIDATEIGARHDRTSWQAALDHYDAARWALTRDEDPDVLDVVGAIVMSGRGAAALAAAERGKAWRPPMSCFLNPLHPTPTGHHRLTDADSSGRRVPVCARCLADLKADRLPDTLDVSVDGRPVHYFDAAAEPWASTGYGALERDLVTAVQRTRR